MLVAVELEPYSLTSVSNNVKLPFLLDWNIAFTFFASFPMLVILVVTDDDVLDKSLQRVRFEHVISISTASLERISSTWHKKFGAANGASQILGIAIGILSSSGILLAATKSASSPWFAPAGQLRLVSYTYLFSISLLIAVIVMFVGRCVWLSRFLSHVVDDARVTIQPFHPDGCGGLRPMGEIGLRNQYTVTVLGLNVVIFIVVSYLHSQHGHDEMYVLVSAVLLYLICGPVVFLGPLLPFHHAMLRDKQLATEEVAARLRVEFERIRREIPAGAIPRSDENLIKRLRWIGGAIDELPVWPFDGATLRKFATAYAIPVGAALLGHLIHGLTGINIPLE
jgi:hypothetical protein